MAYNSWPEGDRRWPAQPLLNDIPWDRGDVSCIYDVIRVQDTTRKGRERGVRGRKGHRGMRAHFGEVRMCSIARDHAVIGVNTIMDWMHACEERGRGRGGFSWELVTEQSQGAACE